ncbi:MAG TPA: HAMP domain-containing sensor histidine kinase [Ktedonosporobacter sp.]|jgi:signal transduction histidine kinase|nr:HAMP domain-containing sensor histidine kinase [Ktedonosporobacter sp.]
MYIPLHLRLTFFYAFILGAALWFFGSTAYGQAQQRYNQAQQQALQDLDQTLSSRAASVQLGKFLFCTPPPGQQGPVLLPSVDGLGTGGVAIEVLDDQLNPIATTMGNPNDYTQSTVEGLTPLPIPFDQQAIQRLLNNPSTVASPSDGLYSTVTYSGQHIRVYTVINNACGNSRHIIQTARSQADIEHLQNNLVPLRMLLLNGGILVMVLALAGGWLISWSLLTVVRRMSKTAQGISASRDFSSRVIHKPLLGKNEFAVLATTFNQMLASLEKAYQSQQRFVADASHELRAPITSIRCNLDLLAKAPDLPQQEVQAALIDARTEAERMGRLVNDLLLLAHADESPRTSRENDGIPASNATDEAVPYGYKKNARAQEVDLDSLLLEVFRQYRAFGEGEHHGEPVKGPRLLLQHITPVKVHGEADQVKQVLIALVDNALKYTPYEGTVSLSLDVADDWAVVKVNDTGIGIAPEDLPHIFERFYRADRARTRDCGGSGLGLSIAQSITQALGGTIAVESAPGRGSIFTLRLRSFDA